MPFCKYCGKPTVDEPTGYYDEQTGKPATVAVCPDECKHNSHNWARVQAKWWWLWFGPWVECKRCKLRI